MGNLTGLSSSSVLKRSLTNQLTFTAVSVFLFAYHIEEGGEK